jgi:hypothetical protein
VHIHIILNGAASITRGQAATTPGLPEETVKFQDRNCKLFS